MEKLIKIDNKNYPDFYRMNIDKYICINSNKDILGIITIDDSQDVNKIRINVMDEFQGNGYGKIFFQKALDEYGANYKDKELRFEIDNESRFNSILSKFGGINISNNNGKLVYIVPVKR